MVFYLIFFLVDFDETDTFRLLVFGILDVLTLFFKCAYVIN